jgi:PAS domain S-box-containing protein
MLRQIESKMETSLLSGAALPVLLPFQHCPDGVLILDRSGVLVGLNAAAERLLSLDSRQDCGHSLAHLLPVSQRAGAIRHLVEWLNQEVLGVPRKKTSWTGKAFARISRGAESVEMDVVAFVSAQFPENVVVMLRDTTLRRLQERAVRFRDQAILDSGTGIILFDATTEEPVIVYTNPAVEKITGLRFEELLGCSPDVLHSPSPSETENSPSLTSLLMSKEPGKVVARHQRADGSEGWSQITLSLVSGDDQQSVTFIGVFMDITEQILAERRLTAANADLDKIVRERTRDLEEKEERFRNILSSLDEVVFSDPADPALPAYVSPSAEKILGRPQNTVALQGQFRLDGLVEEDIPRVQAFKEAVFRHGHATLDYRIRLEDGQLRWLHHRARLIRALDGRLLRVDGYVLDVTDRIHAQSELIQAREAADKANRAKDEFLATMSHEIRTPMQCIFGYTDLLEASGLTSRQQQYLNIVRSQSGNLLQIVNDILDFSKLQSGKVELENLPFALNPFITETLHAFAPAAASKKIVLESFVEPGVPEFLVCDPTRLGQVLANLLSNATKFTDAGSVKVRASLAADSPAPDGDLLVQISVADTGIGIPSDKLDFLFKSFSQLDSSTTRKYGGSGLGLVVCKRLVEMLGGSIWVDASTSGSTFHFTFKAKPAAREDVLAQDTGVTGPAKPDLHFATRHPASILVVEDNPTVLETTLELLRALGYHPKGALDARRALELTASEPFDLIFMDVQMPDVDGLQTTRLIRERATTQRPRIIAMTANALFGDRERCLAAGMDDFVSKPANLAKLKQTLVRAHAAVPTEVAPPPETTPDLTLDERILNELGQLNTTSSPSPLLIRLEQTLHQDTAHLLAKICDASDKADASKLESAAHNLKGAAQVLGAQRMVKLCAELVTMAQTKNFAQAVEKAAVLSAEFKEVSRAFSIYLARLRNKG